MYRRLNQSEMYKIKADQCLAIGDLEFKFMRFSTGLCYE